MPSEVTVDDFYTPELLDKLGRWTDDAGVTTIPERIATTLRAAGIGIVDLDRTRHLVDERVYESTLHRLHLAEARATDLAKEVEETNYVFDLTHAANQRAIKAWHAAHPGNDLVSPDHANMVEWLMDEFTRLRESPLPDQIVPPTPEPIAREPWAALPDGDYAIVELFGHTTLIGRITEVERFGARMLAMQPLFNGALLETIFHGGAAIYRLSPCSRQVAWERQPREAYQLPPTVRAIVPAEALPAPIADAIDDAAERPF